MIKIIFINQEQFGYHSDTYYYCKYLKRDYEVVYLCWDHGLPRIVLEGVTVFYVNRKGIFLLRTVRFLRYALRQTKNKRAIIFIKYFKGLSPALRLLRWKSCFVLDIRTGSVHNNPTIRWFHDARLKFEARFFNHVTVGSKSLAQKLGRGHTAHILPVGAEVISSVEKNFDSIHLLYVGTFFNRNINETIQGFWEFYQEFKDQIPMSYTIIGTGPHKEEKNLQKLVRKYGLEKMVNVKGLIPHLQLEHWFNTANIGVSYVPMTDYYDCQPVTKSFEYLLSGMPVIATRTSENKKVITPRNGVLIDDTSEDFYAGLKIIYEKRYSFDSATIRESARKYTWEKIVRNNLWSYLEGIKKSCL